MEKTIPYVGAGRVWTQGGGACAALVEVCYMLSNVTKITGISVGADVSRTIADLSALRSIHSKFVNPHYMRHPDAPYYDLFPLREETRV